MDIETFATALIQEKGLTNEDPEVQAQLKSDLIDRIENRVNAAVLREMPEEKLEAFNTVLDSGSEEDIATFARETIPDFDEKLALELASFRALYLG